MLRDPIMTAHTRSSKQHTHTGRDDFAGTVAAAAVAPMFERVIILERDDIDIDAASLSRPQAELNDMALVCSPFPSAYSACTVCSAQSAGVARESSCTANPCYGEHTHMRNQDSFLQKTLSTMQYQPDEGQLKSKTNGIFEAS